MKAIKERKQPRLSVNSFAEFNHATSARREKIVMEHKYPKEGGGFGQYRSKIIEEEIHEFLCSHDQELLNFAEKKINARVVTQDWQKSDNENCYAMLKSLSRLDCARLEGYKMVVNTNNAKQSMKIEGLQVSIYPRILVFDKNDVLKGGIITRLTKTQLSQKVREDVALLLKEFLENQRTYESDVDRKLCLSLHVRGSIFTEAPSAFKNRMSNLSSAAKTVVALWGAV